MFEGSVLGVDPGVATVGLAVLARPERRPSLVFTDTVRTPSDLPEPQRLRRIHEAVAASIAEHRPLTVAVETVMWNRNTTSAMAVARATGVVLLAAAEAGLPVEEYQPLEVKMAVTGVGNAAKDQVRAALERAHGLRGVPAQPDACDAVAVALCHMLQSRMRTLTRRAAAR
ncbi:MAG TPA: crossover junction endodeoxyribonuclease RuvC [Actinomycetota bacterium]|nr:crossover junction endodeoxyribonuclease RuvC [Actinomycetota bacterium]